RGPRRPATRRGESGFPERQELAPVGLRALLQRAAQERALGGVPLGAQRAAHLLEAQVDEVGVDRVGLAVVANGADAARPVLLPDIAAVHAELAREAGELRQLVEGRAAAAVERKDIHEVEVPVMEAA